MTRRYTLDELRSRLSQYANSHIDHIACSEEAIYIRFKEGFGSTYGESFSQELYVTTITELKEACKKSRLIPLADWEAQVAVDEITEAFVEAKEIEEAVEAQADEDKLAENQREFEDTHPSLAYMKEKYNELSTEAKDKIEWYSYGYNYGPQDPAEREIMTIRLKDGILSDCQPDLSGDPQPYLELTFKELAQGKLIEATKPEYFVGTPEYKKRVKEATLEPVRVERYHTSRATYGDASKVIQMDTEVHQVQEVRQTTKRKELRPYERV